MQLSMPNSLLPTLVKGVINDPLNMSYSAQAYKPVLICSYYLFFMFKDGVLFNDIPGYSFVSYLIPFNLFLTIFALFITEKALPVVLFIYNMRNPK